MAKEVFRRKLLRPNSQTCFTPTQLRAIATQHRPAALIEGLLYPGAVTLLGGMQKAGKSVLALQAAYALANERPFLGRRTRACRTLYVSADELDNRVVARQSFAFMSVSNDDVRIFIPRDAIDGEIEELLHKTRELWPGYSGPVLIVLDTLQKLLPSKIGGSYAKDTELIKRLAQAIADAAANGREVSILILHHLIKGGRGPWMQSFYGTAGIPAGAQDLWHLSRTKTGGYVLQAEGRNIRGVTLHLERKLHSFPQLDDPKNPTEESHCFEWIVAVALQPSTDIHPVAETILSILKAAGRALLEKDIVIAARSRGITHSRRSLMQWVEQLIEDGFVAKLGIRNKPSYIHRDNVTAPAKGA